MGYKNFNTKAIGSMASKKDLVYNQTPTKSPNTASGIKVIVSNGYPN